MSDSMSSKPPTDLAQFNVKLSASDKETAPNPVNLKSAVNLKG
jgi:hypothetical protein